MEKNYYEKFGLNESATNEEIKRAYHRLAMCFHPDKNLGKKKYEDIFKEIKRIYEVLIDTNARREYDEHLSKERFFAQENANNYHNEGNADKESFMSPILWYLLFIIVFNLLFHGFK